MESYTAIPLLSTIAMLLVVFPILLLLLYETLILAIANRRRNKANNNIHRASRGTLEAVVPIYSEPIELVVEKTRRNSAVLLTSPCFTRLTILSDDSSDYVRNLAEALGYDLPISIFHRPDRRGGRTGALDDYLKNVTATHFLILDVDAEPTLEIATKICTGLQNGGASVIPWEGYFTRGTRLAHAVKFFTDFGSDLLYRMRSQAGLFVFPLGSGTIYDKNVVLDVGGWGDNIIQDDIWMGVKLALNGYDTHLLGELSLRILVPSTLAAFKTQQKRWAYGTSDVLRRSALKLIKSHKLSFWRRLEMLAYMSLPLLTIPVSISFLLLPIAGALEQRITFGMFLEEILYMSSPFILIFPIYYYLYQRLMKKYSLKQTITNLGRFTAILTTLTPTLAWNSLKGLLGLPLSYEVTPKGKKETQEKKPKDPFYMLLWSTLSLFISVLNQNTIIGALSLAFFTASLWTLARAEKIVA
ncbi:MULTISPECIES: glycosyltransferase family 2 protein [Thermofilum]|jgi:cellulose synthase/poly-beta-1,6-N-acetylglucosamine synthase-like glycosyltransferase|uniref:Glycosyltransferase 2-like domain-containing protein n=1 Tax=Thermofilum adornatum TaxID=1365176 RepID=S5ZJ99_9CREN|nr:glycosyltransferase family 2 protein [Thermofilum adornatum]AGT34546.1 hypothetical protein N186_00740 [Thermofilum adornatum]